MSSQADGVLVAAGEFVRAIEEHAKVLATSPTNEELVGRAIEHLRQTAWRYVEWMLENTEWRDPFAMLELESDDPDEVEEVELVTPGDTVTLDVQYQFKIADPKKARELVRRIASQRADGEWREYTEAPSDIITALFMLDGWHPDAYDVEAIEVLSEEWTAS